MQRNFTPIIAAMASLSFNADGTPKAIEKNDDFIVPNEFTLWLGHRNHDNKPLFIVFRPSTNQSFFH